MPAVGVLAAADPGVLTNIVFADVVCGTGVRVCGVFGLCMSLPRVWSCGMLAACQDAIVRRIHLLLCAVSSWMVLT